jgi:sporulation protein YlmC with PRC-barrel domain
VSEPDPVSWKVVEPGWKVVDESGRRVGRVHEITGDPEADIFDGVEVSHGLLEKTEYVPSERVVEIREGEVIVRA